MANKYDTLGMVDKLWKKGLINDQGNSLFLQTLIDSKLEIEANQFFWAEHFSPDPLETALATDPKAAPAFTVRNILRVPDVMLDGHTPLSEVSQTDTDGFEERQGTIPQFARGLYETSMSRVELKARMDALGSDAAMVEQYVKNVAGIVRGANYTLSNMAAQALSRGGAISVNWGQGVPYEMPAYIPAANTVTAGTKVWTALDCDLPEQMRALEEAFRTRTNFKGAMEWNIDSAMIKSVFLKNAKFIEAVNNWMLVYGEQKVIVINNGTSPTSTGIISEENLVAYSQSSLSKISPIRICKQSQMVQSLSGRTSTSGWAANRAVLRPAGLAGVIKHARVADIFMLQNEASNGVEVSTASVQGGLFYIANIVSANGLYRQYHSNIYGRVRPVLDEFVEHVLVKTNEAD